MPAMLQLSNKSIMTDQLLATNVSKDDMHDMLGAGIAPC